MIDNLTRRPFVLRVCTEFDAGEISGRAQSRLPRHSRPGIHLVSDVVEALSAETVGLLGTGAQDGNLDFHTAPEL